MEYITVSAKTLDDAITEALIQLGVTSDQLEYEVIEKGSAGFLGIGMKQAVIKARRKVRRAGSRDCGRCKVRACCYEKGRAQDCKERNCEEGNHKKRDSKERAGKEGGRSGKGREPDNRGLRKVYL